VKRLHRPEVTIGRQSPSSRLHSGLLLVRSKNGLESFKRIYLPRKVLGRACRSSGKRKPTIVSSARCTCAPCLTDDAARSAVERAVCTEESGRARVVIEEDRRGRRTPAVGPLFLV
jgi:hypothetical protein